MKALLPGEFQREVQPFQDDECRLDAFQRHGYAVLEQVVPRERVERARKVCIEALVEQGDAVVTADGDLVPTEGDHVFQGLLDRQDVAFRIRDVLEAPQLQDAVSEALGCQHEPVCYKWLRAVPPHQFTGFHVDRTYLSKAFDLERRGMVSCWIPLGDISPEQGGFIMAESSAASEALVQAAPVELGADGTHSGWLQLTEAQMDSVKWKSQQWRMGDCIIFDVDRLHCTAINNVRSFRLSCDVRFQPSAKKPKKADSAAPPVVE